MILSNNIAQSPEADWDPLLTYTINQRVKVESVHKIYLCTSDTTAGEDPVDQNVDIDGILYWKEIGTTNDFAVFDGRSRRSSENPDNITVQFSPNINFSSISILNISASSLNITVTSVEAGGTTYNKDITLRQLVETYYDFYFSEIEAVENIVRLNDIPPYTDSVITVTATDTGNTVIIGEIIVGTGVQLGTTNYGTSIGINDFSTKEFDEVFGDVFVVERGFNSLVTYDVWVEASRTAYLKRTLSKYRATPLVYIGNPEKEETIVYGFYKNFDTVLEDYGISTMLLEVEELSR